MNKDRFTVGKIVNTHGLKGELKVQYYTETLEDFEEFEYLLIEGEGDEKFVVDNVRSVKNTVLIQFEKFNDINQVERLKNREVYYLRKDYDSLEDGLYYIVDLIGLDVVDRTRGKVGTLSDVLKNTAQDIYVIKKTDGTGEFYMPAVEAFLDRIDIEEGKIYVNLIEGLI
jgi:16S rRNA processing protein RimM